MSSKLLWEHRAVEQLVARWAHNPKVTGSNPVRANRSGAPSGAGDPVAK